MLRVLSGGGVFPAARASQAAPNNPSLSLRRLHFHLFAFWPPVGRVLRKPTKACWTRSTAAAASQGRLGAASPPCPEPRAVPSPCCRNRERLSTLRTGNALADGTMRSCPSHSASRTAPDRVGAVHRVTMERGCRLVRLIVGQHVYAPMHTHAHAHAHTRMRARSPAARPWHASRVDMLQVVSCPCYSALQGS